MATPAANVDNNPAGTPPVETDFSQEIMDTLGIGERDTLSAAEQIAGKAASTPVAPGAATTPPGEPGGATAAPVAPPEPQTPVPADGAPATPAAPEPAPAEPSAAPAAPSAAPATPTPAPQPQPGVVDERALREASLTAQVDAMRRELEALKANPQPGQPPAASPDQPAGEQPIHYGLTIPEQTQQRLLSDNPQENIGAITQIINDLGTIIHNSVLTQMRQEVAAALSRLPSAGGSDPSAAAREANKTAYYEKFPSHNNALVLPIIQSENQKMAAEFPGLPWNDDYMNALGTRVNNAIAAISGGTAPAAEPTPTPAVTAPTPPARPAAMLPGAPRNPAVVTPSGDISAEILDVLDPFSKG